MTVITTRISNELDIIRQAIESYIEEVISLENIKKKYGLED